MWRWGLIGMVFLGMIFISAQALMWFFRVLFYIIS
jgi:hypothetical protein